MDKQPENLKKLLLTYKKDKDFAAFLANMETQTALMSVLQTFLADRQKPITIEGIERIKGDKGDTPLRGVDYFTDADIKDFLNQVTPVKGVHYFTQEDIDILTKAIVELVTPVKGKDYFTREEIEDFKVLVTPKKGVDYFDGKKGDKGDAGESVTAADVLAAVKSDAKFVEELKGKDGSPDTGAEIIAKINAAPLDKKIPASRIEGLDTYAGQRTLHRGGSAIDILDEGSTVLANAQSINFVGSGVAVTLVSGVPTVTINGGSGGTPGGSDTQVQFNDGGSFGGDSTFTFDKTTDRLGVHAIKADASDGLLLEASNGTDIGILGAGNTANVTWYGSHNFDIATANTIASFGASKTLSSLSTATYPDLTELSYVKGVTSAIQTQLNAKANSAGALTQFIGNGNWKVFYSDGNGDIIELALGANGTYLMSNGASSAPTFSTPAGSGDVVGPAGSMDNTIALFDGLTGKLIKDSTVELSTLVPYSGATGTLDLGANDLQVREIFDSGGGNLKFRSNGFDFSDDGVNIGTMDFSGLTGARTYTMPDATGTVALTSDIPTIKESIGFTIDGGGSAISTGKVKGYFTCPYAGTITGWNIMVDAGTATVEVWKVATGTAVPTSGNSINTSGVSISSGTAVHSSTVTDFTTTTVSANDIFAFEVTAVATATEMSFGLEITRT